MMKDVGEEKVTYPLLYILETGVDSKCYDVIREKIVLQYIHLAPGYSARYEKCGRRCQTYLYVFRVEVDG